MHYLNDVNQTIIGLYQKYRDFVCIYANIILASTLPISSCCAATAVLRVPDKAFPENY